MSLLVMKCRICSVDSRTSREEGAVMGVSPNQSAITAIPLALMFPRVGRAEEQHLFVQLSMEKQQGWWGGSRTGKLTLGSVLSTSVFFS